LADYGKEQGMGIEALEAILMDDEFFFLFDFFKVNKPMICNGRNSF
jgi:magnesium-transporting ATPase (P-type)